MIQLEICVFSPESCLNAQQAGAQRVELCAGPHEGGTTPSYGLIQWAREHLSIELYVMIRPRGGDFCYDAFEFDTMKRDVLMAKQLKADGVVLGVLLPDGNIDIERSKTLIELAKPLKVTFHRAFDRTPNPQKALEDVIQAGAVRILTSGQKPAAIEGKDLLKELVVQASGRIEIMAGAGVNAQNAAELIGTGVDALHLTAKSARTGAMQHQNATLSMGAVLTLNENEIMFSDVAKIEAVKKVIVDS